MVDWINTGYLISSNRVLSLNNWLRYCADICDERLVASRDRDGLAVAEVCLVALSRYARLYDDPSGQTHDYISPPNQLLYPERITWLMHQVGAKQAS